jgi:predicted phage baseplate assembly protein
MPFETPTLDDRSFDDLMQEALSLIPRYCPEWTDYNTSDPGITLIELFAWMTDILLYRLNRVPDKHFIKFMEMVGMRLKEAEAARVPVTFYLTAPQVEPVKIDAETVVSTLRLDNAPAIAFTTDLDAEIRPPRLLHVWTLPSAERGKPQRRYNQDYNAQKLRDGQTNNALAVFPSQPPKVNDALYLGFETDLSHHIVGVEVEVERPGDNVITDNPPWAWEAYVGSADDAPVATLHLEEDETGWAACRIDVLIDRRGREIPQDTTGGFNRNGMVKLRLPALQKTTYGGQSAYWLRCRIASDDERNRYRDSPLLRRLEVESWGVTVNATNASVAEGEVVGRSDGTPGQRFYLEHTPVIARGAGEYLYTPAPDGGEDLWVEVQDFSRSGKDDRHYTLDSLSGEIRLGPAMPQPNGEIRHYGIVPPKGTMLVMKRYRYGGGRGGNVAARTITQLKQARPYIAGVTNHDIGRGGRDPEHIDDSKLRVPDHMRSLERAVTAGDYEYLARQATGGVERAYCVPQSQPGYVRLLVIPTVPNQQGYISRESLQLTDALREHLRAYLDQRRLLGTQLVIDAPHYHWVVTRVSVRREPGADFEAVRKAVQERLYRFLNPLTGGRGGRGWPFGVPLSSADIFAELRDVPGVALVRTVNLFEVEPDGRSKTPDAVNEIAVLPDGVIASYEHFCTDDVSVR